MMDLSAYRDIYIEELNDQLERMDQALLSIEREASSSLIQTLFRVAHTIKGSSSTMDFREMSDLTHEVEYVLEAVRSNESLLTPKLIDTLFLALDTMKSLRDRYISGKPYPDCRPVVAFIRELVAKPENEQAHSGDNAAPTVSALLLTLSGEESDIAAAAVDSGLKLLRAAVTLKADCQMMAARHHIVLLRLQEVTEAIIAVSLADNGVADGEDGRYRRFEVLVAVSLTAERVKEHVSGDPDIEQFEVAPFSLTTGTLASGMEEPDAPQGEADRSAASKGEPNRGAVPTVRVNVERLDHLMNLVGELLIDQTSLADLSLRGGREEPLQALRDISGVSDHMARVIKELQEGVMKTRMLPLDQLFSRFPRMVRDLSQKLGKELELIVRGGETELDRMLIEELSDPLIHLIRNGADHGIEAPAEREKLGKPAVGRITLNSFHEENHVVITCEDDGKGIDPDRIKASALAKGIVTSEQAARLTPAEATSLIFEPGFSTASSVTDVSGRGVGMDIVRSQIGRLNGIIDIHSEPGKGTRFTIRLPLTLAIIKGLLVRVSGRVLIIPMYSVAEIVRAAPGDIQVIHGENAILNHGRIVSVSWLSDKLRYPRKERGAKTVPLVIVRAVDKMAAFAVDEILGNQEVVIKSLGANLGAMNHLSGATILGSGQVALILDAAWLVQ